ncbi:hypothetical protein MMC14_001916 [Varicellaria rhodocarpa]|nr:hypothetical protein [Varicellaria rhodocarpa]
MPSKYSHALVLDNYENLGLIDRGQYRQSLYAAQRPPSPASTSQHSPPTPGPNPYQPSSTPSPSPPPPSSDSRTSTPTPASTRTFFISAANARSSSVPSLPHVPSRHSRKSSFTDSLSSLNSTASSSHQASSVVTQIYAPRRPTSHTPTEYHQSCQIPTTPPQRLDLLASPLSRPSPGTVHTRTDSSSTPRSRPTTAKTSLDLYRPMSLVSKELTEDEEHYFGSEEDAASISSLSSSSSSPTDDSIKPRRHPDLAHESYHHPVPFTLPSEDYESGISFVSRERGSSTDDAEPPPIARTRRVHFQSSSNVSKNFLRHSTSNRLGFLRPAFSLSRRSLSSSRTEAGFAKQKPTFPQCDPIPYAIPQARPPQSVSQALIQGKGEWHASVYDISGMSEAEQRRLWKKGVNPRLKAEMEAARKGKWMGPLVGNTFIG